MTAENDVILCVRCILYKKNIQKSLLALIHTLYCLDGGLVRNTMCVLLQFMARSQDET